MNTWAAAIDNLRAPADRVALIGALSPPAADAPIDDGDQVLRRCAYGEHLAPIDDFHVVGALADGSPRYSADCKRCGTVRTTARKLEARRQIALGAVADPGWVGGYRPIEKPCSTCREIKPAGEFRVHQRPGKRLRLRSQCKACEGSHHA